MCISRSSSRREKFGKQIKKFLPEPKIHLSEILELESEGACILTSNFGDSVISHEIKVVAFEWIIVFILEIDGNGRNSVFIKSSDSKL